MLVCSLQLNCNVLFSAQNDRLVVYFYLISVKARQMKSTKSNKTNKFLHLCLSKIIVIFFYYASDLTTKGLHKDAARRFHFHDNGAYFFGMTQLCQLIC